MRRPEPLPTQGSVEEQLEQMPWMPEEYIPDPFPGITEMHHSVYDTRVLDKNGHLLVPWTFSEAKITDLTPTQQATIVSWLEGLYAGYPDSLIIEGKTGVGKSHCMWAVFRYVFTRALLIDFSWWRLSQALAGEKYDSNEYQGYFSHMKRAYVTLIDDFGAGHDTQWSKGKIFELFDTKGEKGRPFIITTNSNESDLAKRYDERSIRRLYQNSSQLIFEETWLGTRIPMSDWKKSE